MISTRLFESSLSPEEQRTRLLEAVLVIGSGIAVAACILTPQFALVIVGACAALWFVGMVVKALRGRFEGILLWWAAVFPLGYYFLSFPTERAVVTLDRIVVLVASIGFFFTKSENDTRVPKSLRQAGIAWLIFAAIATITLVESSSALNTIRVVIDSFLLPFLLGWCVIARFDVRDRLPAIHSATCISSIISAAVAVAEIVTGQDLLPIGGAPTASYGGIIRPNGPFESNDTLALIGAVSLFLLLFLRSGLGAKLSTARRVLHFVGLVSAIGMALMPLFRSVLITLVLALIIDTFWERGAGRRAWRLGLIGISAGAIFMIAVFAPEVFEDRSSAGNVYGRFAQFEQSIQVFTEHPVLGVGLMNFHNYVVGEPRYVATYNGVTSVDWPHDNLAQVLTETGILGFVPYVLSQILLLRSMWQLRRLNHSGYLAWRYFVYLFLTYWITGFSESSGYGPLNLWYMFVVAVIFKYVLTAPASEQVEEDQVLDEAVPGTASTPWPAFLQ
jgi:O-antigen ligase